MENHRKILSNTNRAKTPRRVIIIKVKNISCMYTFCQRHPFLYLLVVRDMVNIEWQLLRFTSEVLRDVIRRLYFEHPQSSGTPMICMKNQVLGSSGSITEKMLSCLFFHS